MTKIQSKRPLHTTDDKKVCGEFTCLVWELMHADKWDWEVTINCDEPGQQFCGEGCPPFEDCDEEAQGYTYDAISVFKAEAGGTLSQTQVDRILNIPVLRTLCFGAKFNPAMGVTFRDGLALSDINPVSDEWQRLYVGNCYNVTGHTIPTEWHSKHKLCRISLYQNYTTAELEDLVNSYKAALDAGMGSNAPYSKKLYIAGNNESTNAATNAVISTLSQAPYNATVIHN